MNWKFWQRQQVPDGGTAANDALAKLAEMLVQDVGKQGLNLDYRVESLAAVDKVLAGYGVGQADQNMGLVELVGAYFGEVLRRQHGGNWFENVPPDGATGLLLDEKAEFWVWCHAVVHKQLQHGGKSLFGIAQEVPTFLRRARGH